MKKSKDLGSFEDFIECLKLYDKHENGTMMLGELEHILLSLGKTKSSSIMYNKLYNGDKFKVKNLTERMLMFSLKNVVILRMMMDLSLTNVSHNANLSLFIL